MSLTIANPLNAPIRVPTMAATGIAGAIGKSISSGVDKYKNKDEHEYKHKANVYGMDTHMADGPILLKSLRDHSSMIQSVQFLDRIIERTENPDCDYKCNVFDLNVNFGKKTMDMKLKKQDGKDIN
jgi:hypothetical protein